MEVAGIEALMKWNDSETYVFFHKQPEGDDETKMAEEAIAVCPTNAIGNDGA